MTKIGTAVGSRVAPVVAITLLLATVLVVGGIARATTKPARTDTTLPSHSWRVENFYADDTTVWVTRVPGFGRCVIVNGSGTAIWCKP